MPIKTSELTTAQRNACWRLLVNQIDEANDKGLKHGALALVAKKFEIHRTTVVQFWRAIVERIASQNLTFASVEMNSKKTHPA